MIKQIRLTTQSKDRLSRLKGKTGIQNWNILSRWALCYSLAENTIPTNLPLVYDSNLEMSWHTFAGEYHEIYGALIKAWCKKHNLAIDDETISKYFMLHLERGISYLSGTNFIRTIDDLLNLSTKAEGDRV